MASLQHAKGGKWMLAAQIVAVILLLALLVFILATELLRSADALQYKTAAVTAVTERLQATGYLLYDATAVESVDLGAIDYRVQNATAVSAGDTLAVVYADGAGAGTRARAKEITDEIERLRALDSTATPPDYHGAYASLMAATSKGTLLGTAADAETLDRALALFAAQGEDAAARAAKIAALQAEFDALIQNDREASNTVKAATAGVFFRETDGFEAVMTAAEAETLTTGGLQALLASPQDTKNAIGRIITAGAWYLALPATEEEAALLSVGDAYEVSFLQTGEVRALTLSRVSARDAEGGLLLILKGEGMPPADRARTQEISLAHTAHAGIAVPMLALQEKEDALGVFVLEDGVAVWRAVTPVYLENGYCLVSANVPAGQLQVGERILVTPRRVYEGKLI